MTASRAGIAVYGGAFNPPHRTHRRVCEAALAQLPVERLLVLPAGDHPWKRDGQLAAGAHRLAMCRIAFDGLPRVAIDDRELRRGGLSFTVDTLQELADEHPGRPLWFVIGADNLRQLPMWREHHRILQLARVATFPRIGWNVDAAALAGLDLTDDERASLLAGTLRLDPDAVAASDLRARLAHGERRIGELDPRVESYAVEHALYRA